MFLACSAIVLQPTIGDYWIQRYRFDAAMHDLRICWTAIVPIGYLLEPPTPHTVCRIIILAACILIPGCGGGGGDGAAPAAADLPSPPASPVAPDPAPCDAGTGPGCTENQFTADADYIYKDGARFDVKAVVYVPGEPGYLPWEVEAMADLPPVLESRIDTDLAGIQKLGANTVRFWGAPAHAYESLRALGELNILQTIWFDGQVSDFQDTVFKAQCKRYIKKVVDRVYSAYPDNNPPVVAFLVGNELSSDSIRSTNRAHSGITFYAGDHFSAADINASEAFIAEMADYLRGYELDTYGKASLISYANEIRTIELIDTPFLDFRSQNVYSYAVPYYRPDTVPGSNSGTLYQGWIEELKYMHPGVPLLVTETGLSVSPNAERLGPPNYGYGGNTEADQAAGIIQNLTDIESAAVSVAGVSIHEYLDAWWKFSLEDSLTQDPNDTEEWFGIVRLIPDGNTFVTEPRRVYDVIQARWAN